MPCQANSRWFIYSILPIVIIAAGLRLFHLSPPLMYSDQAFCWRVANSEDIWQLFERVAGDTHPPGYFLLLRAWCSIAGDDPFTLRLLSALIGTLNVALMFGLTASVMRTFQPGGPQSAVYASACIASLLMAVHAMQIEASRLVRMYAYGMFGAVICTWALVALIAVPDSWSRRVLYGITVALAIYGHSFIFFTLGSHALILAAISISYLVTGNKVRALSVSKATLISYGIAGAFYAPWLPSLILQSKRVAIDFWIPRLTFQRLQEMFVGWSIGYNYYDGMDFTALSTSYSNGISPLALGVIVLIEAIVIRAAIKGDRSVGFFIPLMITPWLGGVIVSVLGDRTILLPRYLLFAQIGLIGAVAVSVGQLRSWARIIGTGLVVLPCLAASVIMLRNVSEKPPSTQLAAEHLRVHYTSGDLIITDRPKRLLELAYYLDQCNLPFALIQCHFPTSRLGGHVNLISALTPNERLPSCVPAKVRRIWYASNDAVVPLDKWPESPQGWKLAQVKTFDAADGVEDMPYSLLLYTRDCVGCIDTTLPKRSTALIGSEAFEVVF